MSDLSDKMLAHMMKRALVGEGGFGWGFRDGLPTDTNFSFDGYIDLEQIALELAEVVENG